MGWLILVVLYFDFIISVALTLVESPLGILPFFKICYTPSIGIYTFVLPLGLYKKSKLQSKGPSIQPQRSIGWLIHNQHFL